MEAPDQIRDRLLRQFPDASVALLPNSAPGGQPSLLLDPRRALAIARFLRDDEALAFDQCSNVTGIDWPEQRHLEVVYHLYSVAKRHGPLTLRLRTANRTDAVTVPSLTPVWRSCEFQEREIFDLFGVVFDGHSDLRRILMWDGFQDHPMRRDYVPPDDNAWEPIPGSAPAVPASPPTTASS